LKTVSFDHSKTRFPLVGQQQSANCKQCHTSLEFAVAKTDCNSCHIDFHEQTVGTDCSRCHTPKSWTVTNIT
jgi:Zn finger protein HypA/HybF involved in hydrogenase expression